MYRIHRLLLLFLLLHLSSATVEIIDRYGKKLDTFQDREAPSDSDFIPVEGFIVAAEPSDACVHIKPPTFLANFTLGKFVLVNGSDSCSYRSKVYNAERAGYDAAVIFDSTTSPFSFMHIVPFPSFEFNIQVVFISYEDGTTIRDNYLFNNSYQFNFVVRIRPNTPDITYYLYLFASVIGVCFFVMLMFMMCLLIKCIQERRKSRRNRLSSRQIKQIPTTKFSKGDQYDVCAICLEDYNEGDKLRILPCSHAYHSKCIDPWLMNNRRNCPLCKRKITFGDSGDESDSEDSELTSPAENTPLLAPTFPGGRGGTASGWGTFVRQPGAGPSSAAAVASFSSDESDDNPFSTPPDDAEVLLPRAAGLSINGPDEIMQDTFNRALAGYRIRAIRALERTMRERTGGNDGANVVVIGRPGRRGERDTAAENELDIDGQESDPFPTVVVVSRAERRS